MGLPLREIKRFLKCPLRLSNLSPSLDGYLKIFKFKIIPISLSSGTEE